MSSKVCTKCSEGVPTKTSPWCRECLNKQQLVYRKRCLDNGKCVDCGTNNHELGRTCCRPCYDKRNIKQKDTQLSNKRKAVEYLGGQCIDCGLRTDIYEVYDFDHINPIEKEVAVSSLMHRRKWDDILPELQKCELRCANCHRIKHRFNRPTRWDYQ